MLEECISETRKLYEDVKIILILDEINEEKAKKFDKNIIFQKSEQLNMSAKRNQGVKIANTDYIGFIDSDAYPNQNWIENAIDFLQNNQDYSAVTGNQFLPPNDDVQKQCLRQIRFWNGLL